MGRRISFHLKTHGRSVVSDGWTNVKHKPLINVLAVNNHGSMFMYAENFSGVEKTGLAIAEFLIQTIESVGSSNVLSVVTDNAANCKAAGKEIEKVYEHIFWFPCYVHTLNLIFKDFAKEFFWLEDTRKNDCQVAKTRFVSHYILLKRLILCREALSTTISLNSWRDWANQGNEQARDVAQAVVNIVRDDHLWNDVENILKITKPIYLVVIFCDGEGLKMGEIYEKMDSMLGEIKDAMEEIIYDLYFPQVKQILLKRWVKMSIPLHCLVFSLSPRFYDTRFLETVAPGGEKRTAPNNDKEVVEGVLVAFTRIAENEAEQKLLREHFATFHMKNGLYSLPAAQLDAVKVEAIDWWSTYGVETPELTKVDKKVLLQPISSSSAE
ncbi:uncharacterized protein LOC143619030 [Bidens hawaiensis]|uniref:uncharacterized protein LOC143619030 n=1 Tax=Bidens hawaiensis TaxID=980011 RepID=UPI0040497A90